MKESSLKRVLSIDEFYRLKQGCKVRKVENLELDVGKPFFVYSPYSKTYYASQIEEHTDMDLLEAYCRDGNVYQENEQ